MADSAPGDPARREALARAALLETTPADTVGEPLASRPTRTASSTCASPARVNTRAGSGSSRSPRSTTAASRPCSSWGSSRRGALVAPDWVPWSVRLAEWKAQQAAAAEAGAELAGDVGDDEAEGLEDSDDELDDDDGDDLGDEDLDGDEDEGDDEDDDVIDDEDDDDDDLDEDAVDGFDDDVDDGPGVRSTHNGDIDGIDVDALDPTNDADTDSPRPNPALAPRPFADAYDALRGRDLFAPDDCSQASRGAPPAAAARRSSGGALTDSEPLHDVLDAPRERARRPMPRRSRRAAGCGRACRYGSVSTTPFAAAPSRRPPRRPTPRSRS